MDNISNTTEIKLQAAVKYRLHGNDNLVNGTVGLLSIVGEKLTLSRDELGQTVTVLERATSDIQSASLDGSLVQILTITFKDGEVIVATFTGENEKIRLRDLIFGIFVVVTPYSLSPEAAGRAANSFKSYFRSRGILTPVPLGKRVKNILVVAVLLGVILFLLYAAVLPFTKN